MKRFVLSAAFVVSALAASVPAHAAATGSFDVNIGLTTGCVISTPPAAVAFTYVANQVAAANLDANGSFAVKCTNSLTYTMGLDNAGSYTDDATNLAYTLSLSAPGGTGNGAAQAYTITGSMAGGQAGSCAASAASCNNGAATNKNRTLTVAY